jgi:hypothetical protein
MLKYEKYKHLISFFLDLPPLSIYLLSFHRRRLYTIPLIIVYCFGFGKNAEKCVRKQHPFTF